MLANVQCMTNRSGEAFGALHSLPTKILYKYLTPLSRIGIFGIQFVSMMLSLRVISWGYFGRCWNVIELFEKSFSFFLIFNF